jgi:hypothetical protein
MGLLLKKPTRAILRRVAIVWIVCLIVLSLQPLRVPDTRVRNYKHQIEHVLAFGSTAMLLLVLARNRREVVSAVGGVVLLGIAIEISQYLIYSLPMLEWWDIREDTIGAALALAAYQMRPITVTEDLRR